MSATVEQVDWLVIGSGAGGLSAAVTAAHGGLKVLVVEKDPQYGGTTAWSGGWMWIPRNPLAVEAGIVEDIAKPLSYLRHELGDQFDDARARAFLENGPRMVEFFRQNTALQFIDGNAMPDFHGNTPDAATGGRSVCAAPFDGRLLGAHIHRLKSPLPETTLWGMGIASGAELKHFLNATRSLKSFWHVTRLVLKHWRDVLLHRRGMRLVNGNALVAGLAASAFKLGVEIRTSSPAQRLIMKGGRVVGAVVSTANGELEIRARYGVVLASGGFPHDAARIRELMPRSANGVTGQDAAHWSAASRGNTGDGLRLGEAAGGTVSRDVLEPMALAPVSLVPQTDGSFAHFPHLLERGKPGLIAVNASGKRFTNEANSYYDFMRDLMANTFADQPTNQSVQAWLVCDHAFIRRYGLGAVKPAPIPMAASLNNGYLKRGATLADLAATCGVDVANLQATVQRYNALALQGKDEDFHKGETAYNRIQGDAAAGHANPCMAPLQYGPFYAVKVVPGSLGTFAGLKVNAHAQVLDTKAEEDGQPIPGLYAAGNDMASMMGGRYPSGGITLGPAMTFGFMAGQHVLATALAGGSGEVQKQPQRPRNAEF